MQIGTFRRQVMKTVATKSTKLALRAVSKSTARTHAASATVALKGHTGQLLQATNQYLLGLPQSQAMKDEASRILGDIGYDLTVLARVLKVKMPSATKKSRLQGTRGAAILQLDSLATDLIRQVEQGLFVAPQMTTVKKMVPMPLKGGKKEERDVDVINVTAEGLAEVTRQDQMREALKLAIDVFWRLCYDLTGTAPVGVLEAKYDRLKQEFPDVEFEKDAATA